MDKQDQQIINNSLESHVLLPLCSKFPHLYGPCYEICQMADILMTSRAVSQSWMQDHPERGSTLAAVLTKQTYLIIRSAHILCMGLAVEAGGRFPKSGHSRARGQGLVLFSLFISVLALPFCLGPNENFRPGLADHDES